jgi:hypothetical protein
MIVVLEARVIVVARSRIPAVGILDLVNSIPNVSRVVDLDNFSTNGFTRWR